MDTLENLPPVVSVFPLTGALLLPRGGLPLNIFEPRYLAMVRDAQAGNGMIAMVQPREAGAEAGPGQPEICGVACLGRIADLKDTDDGRILILLEGVSRLIVASELDAATPYRQVVADYAPFASDLEPATGILNFERGRLLGNLRHYLGARDLSWDWDRLEAVGEEQLINSLANACPFSAAEKQALLEAPALTDRAAILNMLLGISAGPGDHGAVAVH